MPDLEEFDYTLTVTETALSGVNGEVHDWIPCHWEVRNSAQGYSVIDAIRMNMLAPWQTADMETVTPELLIEKGVPALIFKRMLERGLI